MYTQKPAWRNENEWKRLRDKDYEFIKYEFFLRTFMSMQT